MEKSYAFASGNSNFQTLTLDHHTECLQHKVAILDMRDSKNMTLLCQMFMVKKPKSLTVSFKTVF